MSEMDDSSWRIDTKLDPQSIPTLKTLTKILTIDDTSDSLREEIVDLGR